MRPGHATSSAIAPNRRTFCFAIRMQRRAQAGALHPLPPARPGIHDPFHATGVHAQVREARAPEQPPLTQAVHAAAQTSRCLALTACACALAPRARPERAYACLLACFSGDHRTIVHVWLVEVEHVLVAHVAGRPAAVLRVPSLSSSSSFSLFFFCLCACV